MAKGKVKIKENGLRPDHPEKEGVMVDLSDLVFEVRSRIKRKSAIDSLAIEAEGLRVVGGSKKEEPAKTGEDVPLAQEEIGATPAS
jgi:histidyl-tRNA synthetase